MATVQTYINRALRLLGQIPAGQSPTTEESADALVAFNDLVESWRNYGLTVFAMQEETLTLTTSATRTVGPSGSLVTTRPVEIRKAWIVDNGYSYDVRIISHAEYADIGNKTETADWPSVVLIEYGMPNVTLTFWPVPNASRTMKLLTPVATTEFASAATTVSLPPGWSRALAYNLAVELAPEFETTPSPAVVKVAEESLGALKRANIRPIMARSDLTSMVGRPTTANILSGG